MHSLIAVSNDSIYTLMERSDTPEAIDGVMKFERIGLTAAVAATAAFDRRGSFYPYHQGSSLREVTNGVPPDGALVLRHLEP